MDISLRMDMNKICRTCLKTEPDLYLIFKEKMVLNKESLAAILTELTMYKVNRFDELPHHMCGNCVELAKSAYVFKRNCEESYRQLIGMMANDKRSVKGVAPSSQIVLETNRLLLEKFTQTDSCNTYSCEHCEQLFFTSMKLREHREKEHNNRTSFCSKTVDRLGYAHNEEVHQKFDDISRSITTHQFSRQDHISPHRAVKQKIVETLDVPSLCNHENDSSKSEASELNLENNLLTLKHDCKGKWKAETDVEPITALCNRSTNQTSLARDYKEESGKQCDVRSSHLRLSDEEDDKPLSDLINKRRNSVSELKLDESRSDEQNNTSRVDVARNIKLEFVSSSESILKDSIPCHPCKQGKKLQAVDCSSSIADYIELKCSICNTNFRRISMLQRHMRKHDKNDQKSLICKICSKSFTRLDLLMNHISLTHDAATILKCDVCKMEFTNKTQYKRHKLEHTSKAHHCAVCQKSFSSRLYMKRHVALHTIKRFFCKECSERFLTKEELKTHIKSAGHDKLLLCPECGLRCKTSNILMVHLRRHKGEKPFKCKFCSKGFPRMDDLRIHEKYHTGEKSHFCETCGKGFQRKYNLTIHRRVHTGEKPYKCPHCPHAFTQSNDLKSHIRRHTGERFRCEICGASFLQGYQIRQHKLAEHGVKEHSTTQRVEKYTSLEQQEQQIKQNLQRELTMKTVDGINKETFVCQDIANVSDSKILSQTTA